MSERVRCMLLFLLVAVTALPATAAAQESLPDPALLAQANAPDGKTEQAPPPPADSWISDGAALGKWWVMRAKDFDPPRPELLYHLEASYSLEKLTGNDEETVQGQFQQMLLSSPSMRIAGGTDEILRNIIAERVLGLPGDIRVDKDVPYNKIPTKGR